MGEVAEMLAHMERQTGRKGGRMVLVVGENCSSRVIDEALGLGVIVKGHLPMDHYPEPSPMHGPRNRWGALR